MRNPLNMYLLASVLMAAQGGGSGGKPADEDKRKAEADRARENARKALEASQNEADDKRGTDERDVTEQAVGGHQSLDDRLRDTEAVQARSGAEGRSPDEPKDMLVASPGAQFDPASVPRSPGPGLTSAPSTQPRPLSLAAPQRTPDPYEFEDGESTVWGRDERGRVIRPRQYPQLENATVRLTKTVYIDDVLRNEGDVMHNYTGPLGSAMQPVDERGRDIPRNRFRLD